MQIAVLGEGTWTLYWRCSFRQTGQCESLDKWNERSLAPRFLFCMMNSIMLTTNLESLAKFVS